MSFIDIEEGYSYIITVVIVGHGCVINTEPSQKYNIELHSSQHHKDLQVIYQSRMESIWLPTEYSSIYRQDNPYIDKKELVFSGLPYEKVISEYPPAAISKFLEKGCDFFLEGFGLRNAGIWLISIHKRDPRGNIYEYIYPKEKKMAVNLYNIYAIKHIIDHINPSINFTELYDSIIKESHKISKDSLRTWNIELETDRKRIKYVRLTYLLDIIQKILGMNCNINLYDFTCSKVCLGYKKQSVRLSERESTYFKGGKKRKNRNKKRYIKNKKTKRKTKKRKTKKRKTKKRKTKKRKN